jgi:Flp pilus assembly protein protease CpaA
MFTQIVVLKLIVLAAVMIITSYTDIKKGVIKNWVVFPGAVIAFILAYMERGTDGLLWSLGGWGVGAGIFIATWLLGISGAGDAKLMGVYGALLGPYQSLEVIQIWSVITFFILAIIKIQTYGLRLDKAILDEVVVLKHKIDVPKKKIKLAPVFGVAVLISMFIGHATQLTSLLGGFIYY